MTDQTVGVVNQSGTGTLKVDASELTVGANTVERQRMVIADPVGAGLLANVTAGGALKVDASAVTQPVSGAFFQATQPVSLAASVATTPPANASTNVAQVGGTATDTNSGNKSAGTQRFVIATDQPALTNALKVDGSAVTQPVSGTITANQGGAPWSGNVSQINGVTPLMGNGVTGTGSLRVTLASDTTSNTNAFKVDGSAVTQPVSAASLPLPAGAATSANQVVALAQGSTTSGQTGALIQGAVTTSAPAYTTAQTSPLSLTTTGLLRIDGGSSGAMATTVRPIASNGASISRISTAASGVIKASAGTLYAYDFLNTNAAVRYMQIYNKATAGIPGTDTPVMVIGVPANGTARLAFPPQGAAFATGLSWANTTDAPGVTAGASGDIVGTAIYF